MNLFHPDLQTHVGGLSEDNSSASSGGSSRSRKPCCGDWWVKRILGVDWVDIFALAPLALCTQVGYERIPPFESQLEFGI